MEYNFFDDSRRSTPTPSTAPDLDTIAYPLDALSFSDVVTPSSNFDESRTTGDHHENDVRHLMGRFRALRERLLAYPPYIDFSLLDADHSQIHCPPVPDDGRNHEYHEHCRTIAAIRRSLLEIAELDIPSAQDGVREVDEHLDEMGSFVERAWKAHTVERAMGTSNGPELIDTDKHFATQARLGASASSLLISLAAVLVLNLFSGLPTNASGFLLSALRLISSAGIASYPTPSAAVRNRRVPLGGPVDRGPVNIRTAIAFFDLDPDLVPYACCPKCFSCYPPDGGAYPTHCSFRDTPSSSLCNAELLDPGPRGPKPKRVFSYQPLGSWLGRFLSRPGVHELMASTIDEVQPDDEAMRDVFDGSMLRNFMGPDGTTHFLQRSQENEERLLFSLFIDWFNPLGNKISGKKTSLGAVYLVCLNLPKSLRYLPENVYVAGLIPGEPRLHFINNPLLPLVRNLQTAWSPGMWIKRSAAFFEGCLAIVAVALYIADALALRKGAGFASATSRHFCTMCEQTFSQLADFDVDSWTIRDGNRVRGLQEEWRSLPDDASRQAHWKEHQLRWSVLLELPYWDMARFLPIDPMHTLFLNVVQHHVREVLGQHEAETHGVAGMEPHAPDEQRRCFLEAVRAIETKSVSKLKRLRKTYLEVVAEDNNMHISADISKGDLIDEIMLWYGQQPEATRLRVPEPHHSPATDIRKARRPIHIIDKALTQEIRYDMGRTVLPSWINRAPKRFGTASHGKLSADQWRTAATINLPITLIRIWGKPGATQRDADILDNFMALVIAIIYSTARVMHPAYIKIVEDHLQFYYWSLVKHFGTAVLRPSHHLSLHLPRCIRLFGPFHGWWTYPYERYNGLMQRFPNNGKFVQIGTMFIKHFCRVANLKAVFTSLKSSVPIFSEFFAIINRYFNSALRGLLVTDLAISDPLAPQELKDLGNRATSRLPYHLLDALMAHLDASLPNPFLSAYSTLSTADHSQTISPYVEYHPRVRFRGVTFSTSKASKPNSQVIYRSDPTAYSRAGQIEEIFTHTRREPETGVLLTECFFAIRGFVRLSPEEEVVDPYSRFSLCGAALYRNELEPSFSIVRQDGVISHCATCPFDTQGYEREAVASILPPLEDGQQLGLDSSQTYQVVVSLDRDLSTREAEWESNLEDGDLNL